MHSKHVPSTMSPRTFEDMQHDVNCKIFKPFGLGLTPHTQLLYIHIQQNLHKFTYTYTAEFILAFLLKQNESWLIILHCRSLLFVD